MFVNTNFFMSKSGRELLEEHFVYHPSFARDLWNVCHDPKSPIHVDEKLYDDLCRAIVTEGDPDHFWYDFNCAFFWSGREKDYQRAAGVIAKFFQRIKLPPKAETHPLPIFAWITRSLLHSRS